MHGVRKREWWYPTAFSLWGDEEHAAIQRVIASGRYTMGEEVEAFEIEFAAYHGMKYGIMVNSGSSANLIMVAALMNLKERAPLKAGDKVLVPALAWSTTYAPLVQAGLRLQLMDCDQSWCFTGGSFGANVKAAVGVSILGVPATNLPAMRNEARANGAYMLEDNCEALGAAHHGRLCGTFGLMNSFSFFYSHQISAIEGGMILTNDDECARLCKVLRAHGWTRDVSRPANFDEEYNFTCFGYNVRPVEMHAAVARVQLTRLQELVAKRRLNLQFFYRRAEHYGLKEMGYGCKLTPQYAHRLYTSPFGLAFTLETQDARARVVHALREAGIDCRLPTGGSFTRHPYGKPWADQKTPTADHIHECGLFLGNAPFNIEEKIERACQVIQGALA